MKRLDHFLLPALALGGILLLSCQRDDSTSPGADGTRPVAMRLVRTAEVDDYTWFETDSVKVVVKTSSGALLLEKTLAFTSGKLVFGTVSAPGDQGVTITATGYDKGKVIWTGASELAPSASEQTAVIDIRTGSTNSAGVVSAPEILSRSVSHWMTDPDSVKVYDRGVKVVLRNRRDSASYRYTFDGSVPNSKSKTYSADSGILIDSTSDLEVVGLKVGWTASAVLSESFRLRARPVAQDTLNVVAWAPRDTFDQPVTVKLGSETPNVEIRYTLDGKEPTRSSSLYTSAGVVVDSTRTLKAVAYTGKAMRSTETHVRSFVLRARDASVDSLSVQPWAGTDTFDRAVTVKLGSKTPNAEIRYTLDGKEPTRSSSLYTSAGVVVDSTRMLKAVAFAGKAARSAGVLTKSYVMKAQTVSVGSISATAWAAPDTFDQAINVKLANPTPGVEIRYTLDGSTPQATSKLYTADGVAIDTNRTLKAMAWAGKQPSGVVFSRTFAFKARPTTVASFSVEPWTTPDVFDQPVTVKLTSLTPNAEIRYTLDGSTPTRSSTLYTTAGVLVDSTRTLKAVVFAGKAARSAVVLARTITLKARPATVASLSLDPWAPPDTFDRSVTVKLTSLTPNAEIRYSLDGSTPTRSSTLYTTAGVLVDSTRTLKAVVFAGKAARSAEVLTRTFTLRARPATVASLSLDPWAPPDTFDRPVTVKLGSLTPNAEIRYTLDGSTPTRSSALYTTAGVLVDSTRTLKAVVFAGKAARSAEVLTQTFSMKAQPVRFSVGQGLTTFGVALSSPTPGCVIRYTKNGTTPTATSSLYEDSLQFDQMDSVAIRAIAIPTSNRIKPSVEASIRIGPAVGSFVDSRDGQTYKTVQIGAQKWMAQNLNYRNTDGSTDSVGVCYNNSADSCSKYGRLYTWAEVMQGASSSASIPSGVKGICPTGWHVPSDAEWDALMNAVGASSSAGTKLKSTSGWNIYDGTPGDGTDDYGFRALPGGYVKGGSSIGAGSNGLWWSATEGNASNAWNRYMSYYFASVFRNSGSESDGFSARCLED